jgi:hypothetical protein
MTTLSELYAEFRLRVRSHVPTIPLSEQDYFTIFKLGVRRLFVATGRAALYNPATLTSPDSALSITLSQDEQDYIGIAALIAYYQQMMADAMGGDHVTQHKTDALTVTFSDKVIANYQSIISGLELQLREIYHKMPQFAEAMGE